MKASERILITGASGLVGTHLTELLIRNGYEVWHLSRSKKGKHKTFVWNVDQGIVEDEAFEGVTTIIHLAGANVGEKRWTAKRKKEITDSRVQSTQLLIHKLRTLKHKVKNFISASAIGYYGFKTPEQVFSEASPVGSDFLARITKEWEDAAGGVTDIGIRLVTIRIGVVLSANEGALKPMSRTVRWFIGSPLGTGDQYVSWIHLDDLCQIFLKVIEDKRVSGPINAVAPSPVTNRQLTQAIAKALKRPLFMPAVPAFVVRLLFGEMADIVLEGSRVSNQKLIDTGFKFEYLTVNAAVENLLKVNKSRNTSSGTTRQIPGATAARKPISG